MSAGDAYPLALYRDGAEFVWDGRETDCRIVTDADDHAEATAHGWKEAAEYLASARPEDSLLDMNAIQIAERLPALTLAELEALKLAESAGKTRKGVMRLIDEAIDAKLEV